MSEHILEAKTRTEKGRKTYTLRNAGSVPAIVYGAGTEPQMVTVDRNKFVKTYQAAGESSIVELKIDEKPPLHVLIQDYQIDPLRTEYTHIDFRSIDMNKEIETEVELEFVGESAAVKALGGTFIPSLETVAIRALPSKLVRSIQVDISVLATFDDAIHVSDLKAPEGVQILEDLEVTIASVEPPRSDAEMDALNAAVEMDVSAVEVAKEKKEEEGEGEEGAAVAPDAKASGEKKADKK
ncbi:50S ribosomal protein L25 [Patescibacteria group bacterium]|nr:MAG: 50S ribosomal protein L25 [Patescibacteria group bacterium]